jgi:hypothetical protein
LTLALHFAEIRLTLNVANGIRRWAKLRLCAAQQEASPLDAETEQCDERRLTAVF